MKPSFLLFLQQFPIFVHVESQEQGRQQDPLDLLGVSLPCRSHIFAYGQRSARCDNSCFPLDTCLLLRNRGMGGFSKENDTFVKSERAASPV